MDDAIESKLGMSLEDLIKQQKKNLPKKPKNKKQTRVNSNKPGNRRPALTGNRTQQPQRPGNPNQRRNLPQNNTRGGGVQKNSKQRAPMRIDNNTNNRQQQQNQQRQKPNNPRRKTQNKQPLLQKQNKQNHHRQQHHHQQQQNYNPQAPPGFGGPPVYRHNPYQDALYAKSTMPLFIRFDALQKAPIDAIAVATVLQQPDFLNGPTNKHGVRLPI